MTFSIVDTCYNFGQKTPLLAQAGISSFAKWVSRGTKGFCVPCLHSWRQNDNGEGTEAWGNQEAG